MMEGRKKSSYNYWLLSLETCNQEDKNTEELRTVIRKDGLKEDPNDAKSTVLFYHEGIFWRCSYRKDREEESILDFWITNQPTEKICMPVYLSHDPLLEKRRSNLNTDTTTLHRTFWCIMSVLGFTTVMIGVFVTICGIPRANRRLYEAGGALFITGGILLLVVVVTFAVWVQVSGSLERYILERRSSMCPNLYLNLYYGPSFMLAPPACFFSILCGIFLLLTQTASGTVSANATNKPTSVKKDWEASMLE
ncbi:transmembrane protein 182 [Neoarius graeffei]|uniref:transmembrane protein 182 n=1 Tax=Neoarius graeffei TaxID=443677 RepID=UPI00298C263F|nr:transmembrane protein 182 [Neoarius graeffei]